MIYFRIDGTDLPVVETGEIISLNKKAYDLENLGKRYGDFSKSITVASSPQSDLLFGYLFNASVNIKNDTDTNFNPDFNPNLKASAKVINDGVTLIDGYAQLMSIRIINERQIVYILNVYSSVKNFFEEIENKFLEDLDVSEYDHVYGATAITNSWSHTDSEDGGFVYPMIDYGKDNQEVWEDSDFKPAIFVKHYVDKIFQESGYRYSSDFFNSDYFKRLIIPAEYNIQITDQTILDRQFYVGRESTNQTVDFTQYAIAGGVTKQLVFNTDTGSYYNTALSRYSTSTGIFTPTSWNGLYKFKAKIKAKIKYTGSNAWGQNVSGHTNVFFKCNLSIVQYDNNTSTGLVIGSFPLEGFDFNKKRIGTNDETLSREFYVEIPQARVKKNHSIYIVVTSPDASQEGLLSGVYRVLRNPKPYNDFEFILETTSEFGAVLVETTTAIGDTVVMGQVIPKDVKQKDFMVSLLEMFNLYVETDEVDPNKIIIEPRDNFFTDVKEDITSLLDVSNEIHLEPMALLKGNRYEWSYREDNDKENKQYKYMWQEDYGMYRKDILNDFLYDTQKISVIFAPTPLINYPKNQYQTGNDRIISAIKFEDAVSGKNVSKQRIRILYWGGELSTNSPWTWRYFDGTANVVESKTTYPYAGHLDNPYNPNRDLCFGVPRSVFYDNVIGGIDKLTYTDGTLYNVYWKRWIDEITDKNSKVMTCYMRFNPLQYSTLSFRKLYFIDGVTYRLLEVSDYSPMSDRVCKCRFLKYNPKNQHAINTGTFNGGRDTIGGGNDISPGFMRVLTGNTVDRYSDSFVLNDGADKGYVKGFVYGDNNLAGGIKTSMFYANDNEVRADNVVLINTGDRIVESPQVWINDVDAGQYAVVALGWEELRDIRAAATYYQLLPSLASNQYYKVSRVISFYDYNGTAYAGGEFKVYLDGGYALIASNNGANSGTADKYDLWTISAEAMDMGAALVITDDAAAEDPVPEGGNLYLKIYYEIIEF